MGRTILHNYIMYMIKIDASKIKIYVSIMVGDKLICRLQV